MGRQRLYRGLAGGDPQSMASQALPDGARAVPSGAVQVSTPAELVNPSALKGFLKEAKYQEALEKYMSGLKGIYDPVIGMESYLIARDAYNNKKKGTGDYTPFGKGTEWGTALYDLATNLANLKQYQPAGRVMKETPNIKAERA